NSRHFTERIDEVICISGGYASRCIHSLVLNKFVAGVATLDISRNALMRSFAYQAVMRHGASIPWC
ncbi:hypothetical protein, partial [Corynebacterium diphtheriae]|uniref:hypothetical protein n=1 Tax=Corynebacterium diphtheriae TaxID=1717 RepID=UPI002108F3EC